MKLWLVCAVSVLVLSLLGGSTVHSSVVASDNAVSAPIPDAAGCFYTYYGTFGGSKGSDWTDVSVTSGQNCGTAYPTQVQTQSGDYLDRIITTYAPNGLASGHGGGGGQFQYLTLNQSDYISNVTIKYGLFVDSVTMTTVQGLQLFSGGKGGSNTWVSNFAPNEYVSFWFGRTGQYIDALGIATFTLPPTPTPPPITAD